MSDIIFNLFKNFFIIFMIFISYGTKNDTNKRTTV